jgi:hypothetical protein
MGGSSILTVEPFETEAIRETGNRATALNLRNAMLQHRTCSSADGNVLQHAASKMQRATYGTTCTLQPTTTPCCTALRCTALHHHDGTEVPLLGLLRYR